MNGRKFLLVLTSTEMPMQISLFISLLGFVSSPLDSQNDKKQAARVMYNSSKSDLLFFLTFFSSEEKTTSKMQIRFDNSA